MNSGPLSHSAHTAIVASISMAVSAGCQLTPQASESNPTGPEIIVEGVRFVQPLSFLNLTVEQQRVGYRHMERLWPARIVTKGEYVSPLQRSPMDLSHFTYTLEGKTLTLDDFAAQTDVAGLLIIKNGSIVLERYAHGIRQRADGPRCRWPSRLCRCCSVLRSRTVPSRVLMTV